MCTRSKSKELIKCHPLSKTSINLFVQRYKRLPVSMWLVLKLVQFPIVFWIDVHQSFGRGIVIIVTKRSCSSIFVDILCCHIVPIIHTFVSKLTNESTFSDFVAGPRISGVLFHQTSGELHQDTTAIMPTVSLANTTNTLITEFP